MSIMKPYSCPHCGERLGYGDTYDLMRNHLSSCDSDAANKVRNAQAEECFMGDYGD